LKSADLDSNGKVVTYHTCTQGRKKKEEGAAFSVQSETAGQLDLPILQRKREKKKGYLLFQDPTLAVSWAH